MSNRTIAGARQVHGTDPQHLIEKIVRARIYDSVYWKQSCFGLDAATICDRVVELKYIGGTYGGSIKPTDFLCLVLKLLQLQPEKDIVEEYLKQPDFKYLRAVAAFYWRLVGNAKEVYELLEPLLSDYRKLRIRTESGYSITHIDEFIDSLLREDRVCDVILPRITQRTILEELGELEERVSPLQDELEAEDDGSDMEVEHEDEEEVEHKDEEEADEPKRKKRKTKMDELFKKHPDEHESNTATTRASSYTDRSSKGGGAAVEDMSIEETNKLRASLGLPPLK